MGRCPLGDLTASRIFYPCSSRIYANVQPPEKDTDRLRIRFCFAAVTRGYGAPTWWVGAGSPQRRSQLRLNFSWCAFRSSACSGPRRSRPLDRAGTLQISFQFGLWEPHGLSKAVARQTCCACRWGMACFYVEPDLSAVEEPNALPPWCGSFGHDWHRVRDGAAIFDTALAKLVSGGAAPGLRFPRRTPTRFLPQILDPAIPGLNHIPQLDPKPAAPPPDPVLSPVREAYPGI